MTLFLSWQVCELASLQVKSRKEVASSKQQVPSIKLQARSKSYWDRIDKINKMFESRKTQKAERHRKKQKLDSGFRGNGRFGLFLDRLFRRNEGLKICLINKID